MKHALALFLAVLLMFVPMTYAQEGGHGGHEDVEDFCHNPTQTVVIGTAAEGKLFNVTEVKVDKGACVMIMFVNTQDAEHDLAVHFPNGTEYFGLHIVGNGTMQMKMINALMPNEDTVLPYWCTVEDHKEQGMTGEIIVGAGLTSAQERAPFVDIITAIFTMFMVMVWKKKQRLR